MSFGDTTESALLDLIFRATTWANYAINATTTPETSIGFALHTADPGDAGTQATSEATYTSYQRASVLRSSSGFNAVTGPTPTRVTTVNPVDFPAGTGGSGTVNFFSSGKSPFTSGSATAIILSGAVSPTIASGSGVTPRLSPVNLDLD